MAKDMPHKREDLSHWCALMHIGNPHASQWDGRVS